MPAADAPLLDCHAVAGLRPPPLPAPRIVQRLGLDPAPVDLRDPAALRWLCACLWPHDTGRLQRLRQAAALARDAAWPLRQADDCGAAIEPWLDGLPAGVQPVVFNSWVLAYFDAAALARHRVLLFDLVARRGLVWLSAEAPTLALGDAPPPGPADAQVGADELARGSQWWALQCGAGGRPVARLLARSHAHGRWLQWAPDAAPDAEVR